jgi:hypothetical protein
MPRWYTPEGALSAAGIADRVCDMIIEGIRAGPAASMGPAAVGVGTSPKSRGGDSQGGASGSDVIECERCRAPFRCFRADETHCGCCKGKPDGQVENLTESLEFTLNFIKKMNEQAEKFGGFLLEDAHELKQYTPEFQAKVDGDVKSAQGKFEHAVLLVQDLTKEMSSSEIPTESEPTPESNE